MSEYDYKQGKNRITSILDNRMPIEEKYKVPTEQDFTFENGYISWVTAIFVDIRNSTEIFSHDDKERTAKLVRSFTSELIEILRDNDDFMKEIGIRGDCVYAIYSTPTQADVFKCADKTFYINTFMNMLNQLLEKRGYKKLKIGVGMATDKELIIKAGRKGVGINSKVWIGKAVTGASKLSSLGEKDIYNRLVFSPLSYDNFIDELVKQSPNAHKWFTKTYINLTGQYVYHADIVKIAFNNWINNGMKD